MDGNPLAVTVINASAEGGAMENPARILIVDDEPSITEFVSYAMQKEGYLTEVASNG